MMEQDTVISQPLVLSYLITLIIMLASYLQRQTCWAPLNRIFPFVYIHNQPTRSVAPTEAIKGTGSGHQIHGAHNLRTPLIIIIIITSTLLRHSLSLTTPFPLQSQPADVAWERWCFPDCFHWGVLPVPYQQPRGQHRQCW